MIRVLTEGVRRTELIQLQTTDLSTDLIAQPCRVKVHDTLDTLSSEDA
jgi:hypothetical protein